MTHELRATLTLILTPIENIEQAPELEPVIRRNDGYVKSSAKKLPQLVNQLLDLAKLNASGTKPNYSIGDISQFVLDCTENFVTEARLNK